MVDTHDEVLLPPWFHDHREWRRPVTEVLHVKQPGIVADNDERRGSSLTRRRVNFDNTEPPLDAQVTSPH